MEDLLLERTMLADPALPEALLAAAGSRVELALLGAGDRWVVGTAIEEVAFEHVTGLPLVRQGLGSYVVLVPYDTTPEAPPRAFRLNGSLVLDRSTGRLTAHGQAKLPATLALPPAAVGEPWPLAADAPLDAYLSLARQALRDIRAGRYYQINLLRYFTLATVPERSAILARLAQRAGPFGAWLSTGDLTLASFSPERFVRFAPAPSGGDVHAESCPIKGTAARSRDPVADAAAAAALVASQKDGAELAMIVDLMRNDLNRVARRGSVAVPEVKRLDTHANVHHLSARVTATLPGHLRFGELVAALCPGGSITGAPKREVMGAIRAYEGRPRGYFMGTLWYLDDGGIADSAILIRTLVRAPSGAYAFAAGSGIVMASDPEHEGSEIDAKTRVLEPPPPWN